jgi:hypothetical protein
VVNGSAEITLFLVNSTTFEVAAPQVFNLTCNVRDEPIRCGIPASYIYAAEAWDAESVVTIVTLAVRSVTHVLDGSGVQLTISPSCAPGFEVNITVAGPRLQLPFSFFPVTNRSELCKSCSAGTVSTLSDSNMCQICPAGTAAALNHSICVSCFGNAWAPRGTHGSCINCPVNFKVKHKFDDCVSLVFSGIVPRSVVAQVPFELPCISVISTRGEIVNSSHGNVSISLKCAFPVCTASSESVLFQDRVALVNGSACSVSKKFDGPSSVFVNMNVGEDFQWVLEFSGSTSVGIPAIQVISNQRSRFLGLSPAIIRVLPSRASFLGSSVLSVTSSWPILPSIRLPSNRSEYCIFYAPSQNSTLRHVSPAALSGDNQVRLCVAPAGPAFRFFELHVQLADTRISARPAIVDIFCPIGYYVHGGECLQCPNGPSGSSMSLVINASLIQSCVCNIGSYGTHGIFCTTCPKVPALNCSQIGLVFPRVNLGFYADFSKLKDCSWTRSECGAVTACPFGARACPGGAELHCTRSEAECYQGWGCAKCCKMYFLENSRCQACPDASESMLLLGVLAGFAVGIGVMISSATSPSVINSVKYFVQSINFMQNVMALKLFDIPWPTVVLSFFDWLKFFSFSIAAVRPECAFSWDFETKVAFTIITPILLSLAIAFVGAIVGIYKCFNIFIRLDAVRRKLKNSIPYSTLASVVKCWFSVVLFLSVDFSEQTVMWFALSPYLSNRLKARSVKDAKANWKTAISKLRGLSKASMFMKRMSASSSSLSDKLDFRDLTRLQEILKKESLDVDFARIVHQGRKFAGGVFSVLVLSFVGTLTSILSVSKCSDRDGSSFLVQDQDIECSFGSPTYARLFSLAIFGFFVYSVFLPLFIVAILGSSWCDKMRRQDFAGYEAIFGFLVARYSRRHYRWEAMVFLMKSASVAVPVYFTNSPIRQSICMMFVSLVYIFLLFKYSPFANHFLNFSEKVSNLSLFFMYFSAILFLGSVDSSPIVEGVMRQALGISLCVTCILSIVLTFWCALCELSFLALVDRDQFASKWQASLAPHMGISLKEGLPTPFAFLYVYYNAVSRKDIGLKSRIYNEAVVEKLVKLEMANKDVTKRGFWYGVKRKWVYLSVGIELKFLAMCNPVTVLTVADSEDAKLLGIISQLEYQLQRFQSTEVFLSSKILKLWSRTCHYLRYVLFRRKIAPADQDDAELNDDALHFLSAPQDVLFKLFKLRKFLKNTFSSSSRQTLLSIFLFDRSSDFGSFPQSQKYYMNLMRHSDSAKRCIQSLCLLEEELLERHLTFEGKLQYFERFANSLIGREAMILTAFNYANASDMLTLFEKFKFQQIEDGDFAGPSIDELVHIALKSTDPKHSSNTFSPNLVETENSQPSMRSRVLRNSFFADMEAKPVSEDTSEVMNPASLHFECDATSDSFEYRGESGDLKEGLCEGIGTTLFRNGDRYDGHFACGQREGLGTFIWKSGDTYEGNWSKDMFEGFGLLKCKLYTFEGDWVRGQRSGKGKIVFERGDMYDGNWEQDLYSGEGRYTFEHGRVLTGRWLHGKLAEESAVPAQETTLLETRIIPIVPRVQQTLSVYEMAFPSQIVIKEQEKDPRALSNTSKLMQLLDDTQRFRTEIELAQNQLQETELHIKGFEERLQSLRTEEIHCSSRIAEVTEQIEQRKVQKRIQDIDDKVNLLREKRDAMVSEHNLQIIEVRRNIPAHYHQHKKNFETNVITVICMSQKKPKP